MDCKVTKARLRKQLLQQRRSLPYSTWQEKSEKLCQNMQSLSLFKEAKTILAYFSFRQEPDLSFLFSLNHQWGFSRCVGQSLIWHSWLQGNKLEKGNYGILEPLANTPILEASEVDLILVPAVACDYQGYRLGYGGGYYDRLLNLPQWSQIPTIGIVFDFAYLPELPVEAWDRKLVGVCTELNINIMNQIL